MLDVEYSVHKRWEHTKFQTENQWEPATIRFWFRHKFSLFRRKCSKMALHTREINAIHGVWVVTANYWMLHPNHTTHFRVCALMFSLFWVTTQRSMLHHFWTGATGHYRLLFVVLNKFFETSAGGRARGRRGGAVDGMCLLELRFLNKLFLSKPECSA